MPVAFIFKLPSLLTGIYIKQKKPGTQLGLIDYYISARLKISRRLTVIICHFGSVQLLNRVFIMLKRKKCKNEQQNNRKNNNGDHLDSRFLDPVLFILRVVVRKTVRRSSVRGIGRGAFVIIIVFRSHKESPNNYTLSAVMITDNF